MKSKTLGFTLVALILVNGAFGTRKASVHQQGITFKTLYTFTGGSSDGGNPFGRPTMDNKGNLYGMASTGGAYGGCGTIYKLTNHRGSHTLSVLHSFNCADGRAWGNELVQHKGTIYGETTYGGRYGWGTIFSMGIDGKHFTTLHNFKLHSEGGSPWGGLIVDGSGTIYGTTSGGGKAHRGTVFSYSHGKLKTLIDLDGYNTGGNPTAGLKMDQSGNLWGTAHDGGLSGFGVVFELTPDGAGGWSFAVVHDFSGSDGDDPSYGRVAIAKEGRVFGTTYFGGGGNGCGNGGCGVVYELQQGSGYNERIDHRFSGGSDGSQPDGQVMFNQAGDLFGTTEQGGRNNFGAIFELTPTSNGWQESVVHSFAGSDGCVPISGVVFDNNGNAFGAAAYCGIQTACNETGCGTIFEVSGIR